MSLVSHPWQRKHFELAQQLPSRHVAAKRNDDKPIHRVKGRQTPEDIERNREEVRRLLKSDLMHSEIAAMVGVSPTTVSRYAKEFGYAPRRNGRKRYAPRAKK